MRRSTYNTRNPYLPMTEEDVVRRLLHQKTRRLMRKRKKAVGKWLARINTPRFLLASVCALFAAGGLVHFLWRLHRRHRHSRLAPHAAASKESSVAGAAAQHQRLQDAGLEAMEGGRSALRQFPSLEYALSHSKLVALYFAASWCSMSTPVSHLLDREEFTSLLVPPPPSPVGQDAHEEGRGDGHGSVSGEGPFVALVYVSSDRSPGEMARYLQNRPKWMSVPYDSVDRARLKQHFRTAAKVEMTELSMEDRRHEIPTLVVIDSESQQVLTFTGVQDLKEEASSAPLSSSSEGDHHRAVETWLELAKLSQALDAKFDRDGDDAAPAS
jgi:hypothetical protein